MCLIQDNSLWHEAFTLGIAVANTCFTRDEACASRNVYGIVRQHIEMLWALGGDQCKKLSVFEFVLNRTSVSRSSLNKILKDLSKGGYIMMHRGKLIEKKTLPTNY